MRRVPWPVPLLLAVLACSLHSHSTLQHPHRVNAPVIDNESKNLAATQDIDALLQGAQGYGRTVDAIRIAVPPLDDTPLGEAYAAVIITELATTPGITVLERSELTKIIDELRRKGDDKSLVEAGKLLGANALVVGTVIDAGAGHRKLGLRLVQVESSVIMDATWLDLPSSGWEPRVRAQVDDFIARLGLTAGRDVPPLPPLSGRRLELASRARALQYSGKLLDAEPLYAEALAEPSSDWGFEADYLRVMSDLGLYDWSAQRATKVLERIPVNASTMCDRARIFIEKNRRDMAVSDLREATRMAATCGDRELIARSLYLYGLGMASQNYPIAKAALQRAHDLLADGKSAWTRCPIDYHLYDFAVLYEQDFRGSREDHYREIGEACAKAGNLRFASISLVDAAQAAWLPERRLELLEKAIEDANVAGGQQLDAALRASADALREMGRPSEADARLLRMIGVRLRAEIELFGALPDDEQKLDDDLLKRAGVDRPNGDPRSLTEDQQPIAAVHRRALAGALRAWANRTRPESTKQANIYQQIAAAIDPQPADDPDHDKQLMQRDKVALRTILDGGTAPLYRTDAGLRDAFWRLYDWYWALDEKSDQRPVLLRGMKQLAGWVAAPDLHWWSERVEAEALLAQNQPDAALATLRATERYSTKSAAAAFDSIDDEVKAHQQKGDMAKVLELREHQVELAQSLSARRWVDAIATAEAARLGQDATSHTAGAKRLIEAAQDLESKGSYEMAARALEKAAEHFNNGEHADGSQIAVALYMQRAEMLDKLDDPLRSMMARAETLDQIRGYFSQQYRGGMQRVLRTYPPATADVAEIADYCAQLVKEGRQRDAVRLIATLPSAATGVDALMKQGLEWAKTFQDSAEYDHLVGMLHEARGFYVDVEKQKVTEFAAARDAFLADHDLAMATWAQRLLLSEVTSEADLWSAYDKCVEIGASARDVDRADCVSGVAITLNEHHQKITQRDRLVRVLEYGKPLTKGVDDGYGAAQERMNWRTYLATIAGVAGDHDMFESYKAEVKQFYTVTAPDAYQWTTALARWAHSIGAVEPKLGVELFREFHAAGGASSYWIATSGPAEAQIAADAHDAKAEAEFLRLGRAALADNPGERYRYDIYKATRAYHAKDFRTAARAYKEAAASVRRDTPREVRRAREYDFISALALAKAGDLGGARSALHASVKEAQAVDSGGTTDSPCLLEQVAVLASAVERAAGRCTEGDALSTLADHMRARCTDRICVGDVAFCDGPADMWLQATNACHKPLAVTGD